MPWDVFRDGSQYCVHKLTSEGNKGEKESCHDTEEKANRAMAALYAAEEGSTHHEEKTVETQDRRADDQKNTSSNLSEEVENAGDPETSIKSYSQEIRLVSNAWYEQSDWKGYVHDVGPGHVVVEYKDLHWKVPYNKSEDGFSFADSDDWKKAEERAEWIAAENYTIKALNDSRIGAYAVLWGDRNRKDLHGEYFDKETEELKTIFQAMGKIPFLFHHGIDETVKSTVIGAVDVMEEDDKGLWFEAKILEFEAYRDYVEPLIRRKALFPSSGTLPGAKRVTKNGQIMRWPIAEITGTHIPAEYRMLEMPIDQIKSAYKSAGIDVTDFEEQFANEDETKNQFETKGVEETRFKMETELRQSKLKLLELEIN